MSPQALFTVFLLLSLGLVGGCGKPEPPSISLYLAVQGGDLNQLERHIAWGADLNAPDPDGNSPLHTAAARGRIVEARLLIKNGAQIEGKNRQGQTPLALALLNGRTQLAAEMLDRGARLDSRQLVFELVRHQVTDRDVLNFLLQRGLDINSRDANADTPLLLAVRLGSRSMSKLLILHGADINARDAEGATPLLIATRDGHEDLIRLLKTQGAGLPSP